MLHSGNWLSELLFHLKSIYILLVVASSPRNLVG